MSDKRTSKVELLRSVPLFRLCTDKEFGDIAKLADEGSFAAGDVLTTEGTPGHECFIISSGRATVTLRGERLGELGPGNAVGEMALLDRSPRSATVTALTDMEVFVLEPRSFGDLIERHPSVAKLMLAELARRLREVEHSPTAY